METGQVTSHKKTQLIDTSQDRFRDSKPLEHWADIRNMQETSKMLNILSAYGVESREQLEEKSLARYADRVKIVGRLNALQREINDIDDTEKLIKKYLRYKPIYEEYKQSRSKKKFAKEHEKELGQYDAAKKSLTEQFPDKKIPRLETLSARKTELIAQRNKLNEEYKKIIAELEELDYARRTVSEYLDEQTKQKKAAID